MYLASSMTSSTVAMMKCRCKLLGSRVLTGGGGGGRARDDEAVVDLRFPGFLPKVVLKIRDPFARRLAGAPPC